MVVFFYKLIEFLVYRRVPELVFPLDSKVILRPVNAKVERITFLINIFVSRLISMRELNKSITIIIMCVLPG